MLVAHEAQAVVHPQIAAVAHAEAVFVGARAFDEDLRQAGKDAGRIVGVDVVEPEIGVGHHLLGLVAQHIQGIVADERHLEVAAGHGAIDDGGRIVEQVLQAHGRGGRRVGVRRRSGMPPGIGSGKVEILELHRHTSLPARHSCHPGSIMPDSACLGPSSVRSRGQRLLDDRHAPRDVLRRLRIARLFGAQALHAQPGQQRTAPALVRGGGDGRVEQLRRGAARAQQHAGRHQLRQRVLDGGHGAGGGRVRAGAGCRALRFRQQGDVGRLRLAGQLGRIRAVGVCRVGLQGVKAGAVLEGQAGHARGAAQQFDARHQFELARAGHLAAGAPEFRLLDQGVAAQVGGLEAFDRTLRIHFPVRHGRAAGAGGERSANAARADKVTLRFLMAV